MSQTHGSRPLMDLIRQAMDEGAKRPDPLEPPSSAYFDRICTFFDEVTLIKHNEENPIVEDCLKAQDGRSYKIHFATKIANNERFFACLVHNREDEQHLKLAFYSILWRKVHTRRHRLENWPWSVNSSKWSRVSQ
jgi:hypothetical protein